MPVSFDQKIDRSGSNSIKWEFKQREGDPHHWDRTDRSLGEDGVLPMWVADMDFLCPEPVIQAIAARAQRGIYGYTAPGDGFYRAVVNWMSRRHGWDIDPDWICITPGVVPALHMLVRAFTSPGDRVVIQPPVYYPFRSAIERNGAEVVANPLIYEAGRYRMDFADLEQKVQDPRTKMLILCSPHNPVGRVWTRKELLRLGEICIANNVLVVSDEIHGDLIMRGVMFTPFAKISDEFAEHSITCTAPSKTFNLAGLQTSCTIASNPDLRVRLIEVIESNGLSLPNAFGVVALQAAYNHGEAWLEQALDYVSGNLEYLEAFVHKNLPQIDVVRPEGTYLVWMDCRRLGISDEALKKLMLEDARVYLDDGPLFGPEGAGFQRINIACPRSILIEALERIRLAVTRLPA
jgi:cysteine-S-conjugate beta-lyase